MKDEQKTKVQLIEELTKLHQRVEGLETNRTQEKNILPRGERRPLGPLGEAMAIWDWDLQEGKVYVSDLFLEVLGFSRVKYGDDPAGGFNLIHLENRPRVEKKVSDYLQRKMDRYFVEYRLRCGDGGYKFLG